MSAQLDLVDLVLMGGDDSGSLTALSRALLEVFKSRKTDPATGLAVLVSLTISCAQVFGLSIDTLVKIVIDTWADRRRDRV